MARSGRLGWLQGAFVATVLASATLFAYHFFAFRFPGGDFLDFLREAPLVLAGVAGLPLLLLGLWRWLTHGEADGRGAARRLFLQYVAGSPAALLVLTVLGVAACGYWAFDLGRSTVISVTGKGVPRPWQLYVGCRELDEPAASCGRPVAVASQPVMLRIPRAGVPAVVDTGAGRHHVVLRASGPITLPYPAPPPLARPELSAVVFPFRRHAEARRFEFVARNIREALAQPVSTATLAPERVAEATAEHSDGLTRGWAEAGFRPAALVHGEYDDSELRASLKVRAAVLALPLAAGEEPDEESAPPPAWPGVAIGLPMTSPTDIRVPVAESANIATRYPREVAGYVALLLAANALAAAEDGEAGRWLATSHALLDEVEIAAADRYLSAAIEAVAHARREEVAEMAGAVLRLIDAESTPPEVAGIVGGVGFVAALPELTLDLAVAATGAAIQAAWARAAARDATADEPLAALAEATAELERGALAPLFEYVHSHHARLMAKVFAALQDEEPGEYEEMLAAFRSAVGETRELAEAGRVLCGDAPEVIREPDGTVLVLSRRTVALTWSSLREIPREELPEEYRLYLLTLADVCF